MVSVLSTICLFVCLFFQPRLLNFQLSDWFTLYMHVITGTIEVRYWLQALLIVI